MASSRTVQFIAFILTFVGCVPAARAELAPAISGTLVSQYVFRGLRLAGPSVQPAVEFSDQATSFGVSTSAAIQRERRDLFASETDVFASHRFALKARTGIRLGITGYFYGDAAPGWRRSAVETSLAVDCTIGPVQLTPALYYDLTRKGLTGEMTAAVALPLRRFGTELDLTASAGTYRLTEAFTVTRNQSELRGSYGSMDASVPWQITPTSRITMGLTFSFGTHSRRFAGLQFGEGERVVGRVGYTHSW